MEIKLHKKIRLDSSIMVAGWPGMGGVATDTVNYLRRKLNAKIFAEINTKNLFVPEGVLVNKGNISLPRAPSAFFHYRKHPPVTLLEGTAQLYGQEAYALLDKVLETAKEVNTEAIITSAAFPVPMSRQDEPEIYFASNNHSLSKDLKEFGLKPLNAGQISGLNGILLGHAKTARIDAACLLATIPQYTVGIQNPRAVLEIIDVLGAIIDEEIDLTELEDRIEEMDKNLDAVETKINDFMSYFPDREITDASPQEVPGEIMKKIEKLFEEAKSNRQKAVKLKEELDRWDIYPMYEDRFLDLFKKTH